MWDYEVYHRYKKQHDLEYVGKMIHHKEGHVSLANIQIL
ncbi:hypothetical protein HOU04_gp071 [Synechococcus phage S-T4]|uniref:Uncharacterized protein n=1 Tax=Synechococcus phage S-T4 TaxID=2268578 RepID=A0A385EFN0_9CAUD|nr:hypothetical protein HOU04_gp071 [Synechococcus phage S-T4]AXQ70470.1 hypothetical protein [Synechococcus phage S-T4]